MINMDITLPYAAMDKAYNLTATKDFFEFDFIHKSRHSFDFLCEIDGYIVSNDCLWVCGFSKDYRSVILTNGRIRHEFKEEDLEVCIKRRGSYQRNDPCDVLNILGVKRGIDENGEYLMYEIVTKEEAMRHYNEYEPFCRLGYDAMREVMR